MSITITVVNVGNESHDIDVKDEVCNKIVINGTFHSKGERSSTVCRDREPDGNQKGNVTIINIETGMEKAFHDVQDDQILAFNFD